MLFIDSNNYNPGFNLALEEYIFEELPTTEDYFMLWQNHNTIVIGKNQNTVEEINQEYVKKQDINVVRRLSGGGAVYHDMGNLNFTFIANADKIDVLNMEVFCQPIIDTLEKIGIKAELNGRNDITIDNKKFSGNSQYVSHGRVMHHGTIMFDSDLSTVAQSLNVSQEKIESKGLKSIKSRVTNIKDHIDEDMPMKEFKDILIENIFDRSERKDYHLSSADVNRINEIKKRRYDTWEWTYGNSPDYKIIKERRVPDCGKIEVYMDVKQGQIDAIKLYGDFFGSGDTRELEDRLKGAKLKSDHLPAILESINLPYYIYNLPKEVFAEILLS